MKGIILKRLTIVGENREPASVEFEKGLNIISGPSDTGKSFIFECINFMLGSNQEPKSFKESKGYTKAFLEFETNNTIFTLERMLNGGEFKLYTGEFNQIYNLKSKTLNDTHKAGNLDNISGFLLDLSSFPIPSWVKKNQHNKKESLSFRNLKNFITVDEVRVITQESPIHSGQYTDITLEKSIFKLLITGNDDSYLEEIEKPEIKKAKLLAKLDMLDELISETKSEMKKNKNNINDEKIINHELDNFKSLLSTINNEIDELNSQRKILWLEFKQKESKIIHNNELVKRFNLLEEQYEADIKRLQFIDEGTHYFFQLNTIKCPNCGKELKDDNCIDSSEFDLEGIKESCFAEISKIKLSLVDLKGSKSNLNQDVMDLEREIIVLKKEHDEIVNAIDKNLQPRSIKVQESLDLLMNNYQTILEVNSLKEKLNILLSKHENIEKLMKNKKQVEKVKPIEIDTIVNDTEFKDILYDILLSWGFEDLSDYSDLIFKIQGREKKIDIEISGKERKSYGKGYRGLIYSAFVVGLMKYCFEKGLPHPGFIIIDSPVTTFKDAKKQKLNEDDIIPIDKQNAFFNDLSQNYNDRQIIIFENKEPLSHIKEKVNYIEFTKDYNHGRYGFFKPIT